MQESQAVSLFPAVDKKIASEYDQAKTIITIGRQTHGTALKGHTIIMRHQEDKLARNQLYEAAINKQESMQTQNINKPHF